MHRFKKIPVNKSAITLIGLCLLAPISAYAEVEFMSLEKFRDRGGERYWEVSVVCEGDTVKKGIKRILGHGRLWCLKDDSEQCDKSKYALSETICAGFTEQTNLTETDEVNDADVQEVLTSLDDNLSASDAPPVTAAQVTEKSDAQIKEERKSALLREQVYIEEQRILIEQKRLELVQSELLLKKQKGN